MERNKIWDTNETLKFNLETMCRSKIWSASSELRSYFFFYQDVSIVTLAFV